MTGTIEIDIESNASLLASVMGGIARTQIPFATAQALNDVAFMGMREAKSHLDDDLQIRNRFSQAGIQVNKAHKSDTPITADVGIEERRSYLIDHVTGGNRTGNPQHGRAVLQDKKLRNARGRIPKGKRPTALLRSRRRANNASRPFIIKKTNGQELIAQRTSDDRYPLQILYAFERKVSIKKTFPMDKIVQAEVSASYPKAFEKRLDRAIKTAKPKGNR